MNSLTSKTYWDIYKAQFKFKMSKHLDLIIYLIILQIAGEILFLSTGGIQMGSSSPLVEIEYHLYSPIFVLLFSAAWAVYMGTVLTKSEQRAQMTPFINISKIDHVTNISLFLCFAIFASVTSMLLNYVTRIVLLLGFSSSAIIIDATNLVHEPLLIVENIGIGILILLLVMTISYFLGLLAYKYKFVYTITFVLGCAFTYWLQQQDVQFIYEMVSNPVLLLVSIILAILLLFGMSFRFSTAWEGR